MEKQNNKLNMLFNLHCSCYECMERTKMNFGKILLENKDSPLYNEMKEQFDYSMKLYGEYIKEIEAVKKARCKVNKAIELELKNDCDKYTICANRLHMKFCKKVDKKNAKRRKFYNSVKKLEKIYTF